MRPRAVLLGLLLALSAPLVARADTPPSLWDTVKDPAARDRYRLHMVIDQLLLRASEGRRVDGTGLPAPASDPARLAYERAREILESIDARHSPDIELRRDYAWYAGFKASFAVPDWAAVAEVLESVVRDAPDLPDLASVYSDMAEAYVHLQRPKDEIHAWDEVLARARTDAERVTPLLNQGEAFMRTGDLSQALSQFREVAALSIVVDEATSGVLAQWDIAVALDRSGDLLHALKAARAAEHMDPRGALYSVLPAQDGGAPYVYFDPEYERDWYIALAFEALADEATTAEQRAQHLAVAESHFSIYVSRARPDDHWLPIARARLAKVHARRAAAEAALRKAHRSTPRPLDR